MNDTIALDILGDFFVNNHHTLAVAESVTAGLLQNAFSNAPNASAFFQGGIVAYNLLQKCTQLFIDPVHAAACNCVSEEVAGQMALGVAAAFNANWAIGITGYASAVPELGIKDLFCCYAFVYKKRIVKTHTIFAAANMPGKVQQLYVECLLNDLAFTIEQWHAGIGTAVLPAK